MRLAVLDLGSTSFHLLVAAASADGTVEPVVRERVHVGLGGALASAGGIAPHDADRAVDVCGRLSQVAERAGAQRTIAVATAALRGCANGVEILERIERAARNPVRVLDGHEEARLAFLGMAAAVGIAPGGRMLAADLGGGSFELAVGDARGVVCTESLDLGVERLAATHGAGVRPSASQCRSVTEAVDAALADAWPVPSTELLRAVEVVVGGGWARAVGKAAAGARLGALPRSVNRLSLEADELAALVDALASCGVEARTEMPGVKSLRAGFLPVAAIVVHALAARARGQRVVVSDWGLREGVLLDALDAPPPLSHRGVRQASVQRVEETLSRGDGHAAHVAVLAADLAAALAEPLGLSAGARDLLSQAALLHDVGASVSSDGHHRHGAYVVQQARLRGFDPTEVAMIAAMIRHHARARPTRSISARLPLDERQHGDLVAATAILRLADALDRPRCGTTRIEGVELGASRCVIRLHDDAGGSSWSAAARADLLEDLLGRPVEFTTPAPALIGASRVPSRGEAVCE